MAITGLSNSGSLGGLGGSGGSGGSGFTESQIKQIILTDIRTPGTLLHQEVVSVANDINVLNIVYQDLQPTNQNSSLFDTIATIAANMSAETITEALDGNSAAGIIYQAIENTMLAEGGIIYNAMDTFVENAIDSYATSIGVGSNGQAYNTVYEAVAFAISNELEQGGTLDSAIKAGGWGGSGLNESQIKQIILTDLQSPGSELYAECEYIATSSVAYAVTDTNSILYQNLVTAIDNTLYIALDSNSNGMIYMAITDKISSYADSIGVGGNDTSYHTVYDAADDAITNQLSLGGTIDSAIKAGGA